MRKRLLGVSGIFLAVLVSGSAQAQAPDGKMQTFITSDFYKGLINRALDSLHPSVFQRCPALRSPGSNITVLQPIIFAPDGYPKAGSWLQKFPVSGCGNDTVLNFYFSATPDEKVNTVIGLPGTTRADLVLQRDAKIYAGVALAAHGCKGDAQVKNTHLEGFGVPNPPIADPGPGQRLRPWWETWTMIACGRTFEVPIDFVPSEKSTQIIQPAHVIER
jgi:hypothetical protein